MSNQRKSIPENTSTILLYIAQIDFKHITPQPSPDYPGANMKYQQSTQWTVFERRAISTSNILYSPKAHIPGRAFQTSTGSCHPSYVRLHETHSANAKPTGILRAYITTTNDHLYALRVNERPTLNTSIHGSILPISQSVLALSRWLILPKHTIRRI